MKEEGSRTWEERVQEVFTKVELGVPEIYEDSEKGG